jgi:hypothetical protein
VLAHRHSEAATESDSRMGVMMGSCSDKKKRGVRACRGSGKRRPRAALTGGVESSAARQQCGRWWLAPVQAAGRGGEGGRWGLSLIQDGEETERERKRGRGGGCARFNGHGGWGTRFNGLGGVEQRGAARGGAIWRGGWGEAWGCLTQPADGARPAVARGRRVWVVWCGHAARSARRG